MELVPPTTAYLPGFLDALRRGWSPNTVADTSAELLAEVEADPLDYLAEITDRDPHGRTVTLPDGTVAPRLPGFSRWIWDGEFCGSVGVRWQPGTPQLPPHVLGHIGYTVVPWKRRRGYATQGLRLLLDELSGPDGVDLPYVDLTTDVDNRPSQKVITANGGSLVGEVDSGPHYGGRRMLLWRVRLRPRNSPRTNGRLRGSSAGGSSVPRESGRADGRCPST